MRPDSLKGKTPREIEDQILKEFEEFCSSQSLEQLKDLLERAKLVTHTDEIGKKEETIKRVAREKFGVDL
ncbi:MAG: hypothetical protein AAB945_00510 [Patescibacteria group bacterium]